MTHTRKFFWPLAAFAITSATYLLSSASCAQPAVERERFTSREDSEWLAMDGALKLYLLDHQRDFAQDVDQTVLPGGRVLESGSFPALPGVNDRSRRVLDDLCRQMNAGSLDSPGGAIAAGRMVELSERYEREDITAYYKNFLAGLPSETARQLEASKNELGQRLGNRRNIDWQEYARLYPEQFLADRANRCDRK
jgi:hypothetical protein